MSWRYMSARETFQGEEVWTIREVYDAKLRRLFINDQPSRREG